MIRGNLCNEARASTRSALLLVAELPTLGQLAEAIGMTMDAPTRARADHERRVEV
jgi:hypothetical protein